MPAGKQVCDEGPGSLSQLPALKGPAWTCGDCVSPSRGTVPDTPSPQISCIIVGFHWRPSFQHLAVGAHLSHTPATALEL